MSKELFSPYVTGLTHNLILLTPGTLDRFYFCNSGTGAVKTAMKLAARFFRQASTFYLCREFAPRQTLGALSVTGGEKLRQYLPLLPETRVPYGDADAIEKIRELYNKYGVLLLLDEIQTGMCRIGSCFACQYEEVISDLLVIAKSLGGGMATIGATIATTKVFETAYSNLHDCPVQTSTFGGQTTCCAAAIAALAVYRPAKPDHLSLSGSGFSSNQPCCEGYGCCDRSKREKRTPCY